MTTCHCHPLCDCVPLQVVKFQLIKLGRHLSSLSQALLQEPCSVRTDQQSTRDLLHAAKLDLHHNINNLATVRDVTIKQLCFTPYVWTAL